MTANLIHFNNTDLLMVLLFASTSQLDAVSMGRGSRSRIYTDNNCAGGYIEAGSERDSRTTVTFLRPATFTSEPRRYCFLVTGQFQCARESCTMEHALWLSSQSSVSV